MNSKKLGITTLYRLTMIGLFGFTVLCNTGCGSDNITQPAVSPGEAGVDEDVAVSVASAVAEETGGAVDQVGDIVAAAACSDFEDLDASLESEPGTTAEMNYDEGEGLWIITLSRERGNPSGNPYASIHRVYTLQYLTENGTPQKYWVVDTDTATTINCTVREGDGLHRTTFLAQELNALDAEFTATGTNTPVATINGTYHRSASDEITSRGADRTADNVIDLILVDVKAPLGDRSDLALNISGTITGTYQAEIEFTGKDLYFERSVYRNIQINLGSGDAVITVENKIFTGDISTGELNGL